jgi:hypothetical protein
MRNHGCWGSGGRLTKALADRSLLAMRNSPWADTLYKSHPMGIEEARRHEDRVVQVCAVLGSGYAPSTYVIRPI